MCKMPKSLYDRKADVMDGKFNKQMSKNLENKLK